MKKRTTWISLLLATLMVLTLAIGSIGTAFAAEPEQVELSLWHIWPSDMKTEFIADFVEQYMADNPHVKITIDATQQDEYQQRKLKVATATGMQGDVFYTWGAGYAQQFVDAGAVLPLDAYFEADNTYDRMLDGVLDYFTYDGKVYGIPNKNWCGILFCNTELFEEYGVEYPETWDQLMTAVSTFREAGLTPMALGAKDAWHIGMYQNALALRTAGVDACNDALLGDASFDTPEIVESARLMKELYDAEAFMKGTLGIAYDEAQMEFFMGLVPMYYSGDWTAQDCDDPENDIQGKVKVMSMPAVPNGKGDTTTFLGGVVEGYMVNAHTKYPEEAVRFAIALTEYQSQMSYIVGDGMPAWKTNIDESDVSPTLLAIKNLISDATGYVLAWDTALVGSAIDAHYNLLQQLLGGEVTPEEFAQKMQEANEAQLAEDAQ